MTNRQIKKELDKRLSKRSIPRLHLYYGDGEKKGVTVNTSRTCFDLVRHEFTHLEHVEEFMLVGLNRSNGVIGVVPISLGGLHSCHADPRVVFGAALAMQASGIIIAHNHPSGVTRPSEEDLRLTRKIVSGALFLDIHVYDHLIVTTDGYYSFADNGQLR